MFLFLFLFEFSKNCFILRYLEEAFPSHTNVSVMINQTHNLYGIDRQNTTMNKTSLFQELRKAAARTKRKNRKKTPKKRPKTTTTTTTPIAQSLYVTVPLMYKELSAFSKAFQNDVNAIDWSLLGPSSPLSESMYVHPFVLRQVATATAPHVLLPHMAVPTFSKCFQNCSLTHHIIFSKPTTTTPMHHHTHPDTICGWASKASRPACITTRYSISFTSCTGSNCFIWPVPCTTCK